MNRVQLLVVQLALVLATPLAATQQPAHDPIWGDDALAGPRRAGPPATQSAPIVPKDWLAIADAGARDPVELVLPWTLDTEREPPVAGGVWQPISGPRLPATACAFTIVVAEADEVRMARLTGARWLVVDDSAHIGDPERRGDRGVPFALKKGQNRIFVIDAGPGWELELWKPPARCVVGAWDVGWPETTGDEWEVRFPVFNASTEHARNVHIHYGELFVPGPDQPNVVDEWADGGSIAALAIGQFAAPAWSIDHARTPGRAGNRMPLVVYSDGDDEAAREVLCDRDPSYERRRLGPAERERGRTALGARPQSRISGRALLVYGTQGDAATTRVLLARARLDQQVLWYECGDLPTVVADTQRVAAVADAERWRIQEWASFSDDPVPVVLYGDVATNAAWTPLRASGDALEPDANGVLRRNEAFYGVQTVDADAWTHARAPVRRLYPGRSVLAFASRGAVGARLSLGLGMLRSAPESARIDPGSPTGYVVGSPR